jgi:hypothetical protein
LLRYAPRFYHCIVIYEVEVELEVRGLPTIVFLQIYECEFEVRIEVAMLREFEFTLLRSLKSSL